MSSTATTHTVLWPAYETPADLAAIEAVRLEDRGLPETTYDALTRAARLWPDRPAIRVMPDAARWQQPVERTYSELLEAVDVHATVLSALGVQRSDAVTLLAPNCCELIEMFLAAQRVGIAAPVNPAMDSAHVADLIRRTGSRVLVTAGPALDDQVFGRVDSILAAVPSIDTVLLLQPTGVGDTDVAPPQLRAGVSVQYLASPFASTGSVRTGAPPVGDDLASLFHTGGTTGTPKLAAHRHSNEIADAWMIAANSVLDEHAVVFAALPLFHVNALIVTVLAPMLRGQTVVWAGPLGYRDVGLYGVFWQMVQAEKIAAMSAVPTVYSVLTQCPVDADISSMRACLVGASLLPPAVRSAFESHTGVPLLEGYGLTEATCASVRSFLHGQPQGSVGQRMPYQRIKAVDDDGVDVPAGHPGRLLIAGPTVFAGYVRGRTDTGFVLDAAGTVNEGWLDTGDLGAVDDDGFVTLTGRAKDLIIRGGHNIDPAAVEDALLAHPDVTGAGVVGRPDIHAGEVPIGYVTLRDGAAVSPDELAAFAAEHVSESAAAPKTVTIVEALPVTDVGKPYKLALRAEATRTAVENALTDASIPTPVSSRIDDGSVVAVVTRPDDDAAASEVLNAFAVRWEWATNSDGTS